MGFPGGWRSAAKSSENRTTSWNKCETTKLVKLLSFDYFGEGVVKVKLEKTGYRCKDS